MMGLVVVPMLAAAQSTSGLTSAQLRQLRQLNMPIVAPVPKPRGFRVTRIVSNSYDKTYKIFYQDTMGATIVFQGSEAYSSSAKAPGTAAAAAPAPAAAPKRHGFFQRLFAGAPIAAAPSSSSSVRGTSSEAEGQAGGGIVADSTLIGPIRFAPAGPCLQGTADGSKSQIRGLRVTVSACNSDNPDPLIAAYKNVRRL